LKSGKLYLVVIGLWLALLAAATPTAVGELTRAGRHGMGVFTLVATCTVFVSWFWLNGLKDVVYSLWFHFRVGAIEPPPAQVRKLKRDQPRVLLVYCTCNDFDPHSLAISMRQRYKNFGVVILDDSSKPEYVTAIDEFAAATGVEVRRRRDRSGFKAGNLNNFLGDANYDYFVILDSDEVIPRHFIYRALDYFDADPSVGIVQANHVATRNRNRFMQTFAAGVDSHWPAYQSVKARFGFLSLLGHGAMVSKDCYLGAGGFPHVVAEDLCFSIRARGAGFTTTFAADVVCEEEYPVNYLAFKKRHAKWTQGNMEFVKKFSVEILRSPMRWFEKLDILLFTYSLPLTAFFFMYLLINLIVLPSLGYAIAWSSWLLVPTLIFLAAPMMNDVLTYAKTSRRRDIAWYCMHAVFLYGSMFFTSLRASATSLFGRSVFCVTPKEDDDIGTSAAFRANAADILSALLLLAVCVEIEQSIWPCLLIVGTALSGMYLTLMSNDRDWGRRQLRRPVPAPAISYETSGGSR
jgi:cellulose synthase/poly-beta-1,6-N-acetylglucosamine synthase-like glycosyltransferase